MGIASGSPHARLALPTDVLFPSPADTGICLVASVMSWVGMASWNLLLACIGFDF